jgi:2-polyprenyl-3-methyl-5-hydroxy-6-metoxy-1,4-benzoquinol methylase
MIELAECPGCGGRAFREVYAYNDLVYRPEPAARAIAISAFSACSVCGLFFARHRQDCDSVAEFYTSFAEFENRRYAVYPPPATYVRGKEKRAAQICGGLAERGLLRSGLAVLHVRCDGGTLLARLRAGWNVSELYGLDYFDSNIRYATEVLNLPHVGKLDGRCLIPFGRRFDLIIANHMLTHALEPRPFLATLRELLKPDGAVFFYDENDHEVLLDTTRELLAGGINAFHKQLLTELSLANLLRRAGFAFDAIQREGAWLEVLTTPTTTVAATPKGEANEIARLHAMFAAWAKRHERQRTRRRLRRLIAKWPAAKRLKRLLVGLTGRRAQKPALADHQETP